MADSNKPGTTRFNPFVINRQINPGINNFLYLTNKLTKRLTVFFFIYLDAWKVHGGNTRNSFRNNFENQDFAINSAEYQSGKGVFLLKVEHYLRYKMPDRILALFIQIKELSSSSFSFKIMYAIRTVHDFHIGINFEIDNRKLENNIFN